MLNRLLSTAAVLALSLSAANAADLSEMSWDEIVAQAKQEGELTWYVWYLQDDLRRAVQAFEDEYGIKVTIPEGTAAGNADKMMAEAGRETGDIDVFSWGYDSFSTIELAQYFTPLTMLPEDAGRVNKLAGVDGGEYVLAFWGNQSGIAYDPAYVAAEDLPQTPEEFAAFWHANPGKFGFNYENGGSGPAFYENMLRVISGAEWNDGEVTDAKLAALEPGYELFNAEAGDYVITASNADSIIRISDGELWMAPAWEDHLAGLQNRNEVRGDIAFYIPEMGMSGGGNGVALPANAPHSAAAAVFINWVTSPEVQTMMNETFGTAPMNQAADDSHALVPMAQRAFSVASGAQPYRGKVQEAFIDNVILER